MYLRNYVPVGEVSKFDWIFLLEASDQFKQFHSLFIKENLSKHIEYRKSKFALSPLSCCQSNSF